MAPISVDLAILGSGPAGLSAAARAAQRGMSHVLLEKTDHLSDTIYKYQKGKHIMATPGQLVLRSDMPFEAGKREAVLARWDGEAARARINVRLRSDVISVTGQRGDFTITLADGATVQAKAVILAIGTAGNPNRLQIPGGDLPMVQYQLDDPRAYFDEDIVVVGGGDAGIENALGLADPDLGNRVTLLQRGPDFSRAKPANVQLLEQARAQGRLDVITDCAPRSLEPGMMIVDAKEGELRLPCKRVIARLGSTPPRKFVESCGVAFTGPDREAFPRLSPAYESSVPGLYIIGALAGYPLIKHCMNQGYDVVEYIAGNTTLKPADEPLLEAKFAHVPVRRSVDQWLEFLRTQIDIFRELSPLQMREFMLESDVRFYRKDDRIITRNDVGSSLFAIAEGTVLVEIDAANPNVTVPIGAGQIFGEIGLISGRRRGATIRAGGDALLVEVPRSAALKLMGTVPGVKRRIDRITTDRMLKTIFGGDIDQVRLDRILDAATLRTLKPQEPLITEGEVGYDIFVIRSGSLVVEKRVGAKNVFLSYVPAGAYVGEMALFDNGRRNATVRATVNTEVITLPGAMFKELLAAYPNTAKRVQEQVANRRRVTDYVEAQKAGFSGVVDMYTSVADFLVQEGLGEATDALLIDERLCIGCDQCEVACAESHDGISRLDREAGHTYAHIHVPTSCRHCENPHCMTDCPPNAIRRAPDGEVFIDEKCIGCGNCQRSCPYGVIQMEKTPPKKPGLLAWLLLGAGPGPGQASHAWVESQLARRASEAPKVAVKCDMCKGIKGGPACVRACPTGAAIRVSPEGYLRVARMAGAES
ncbi:MAG: NAD(P)-binding domain-containing protein [Hyphomonadaceae bacterium]|nr:NAD(P)-binding domain-containing protein [Hyphomonadaceae bacterium]